MSDLQYAFRSLTKNPGFALVAILTLALGIGANTALFSVVNAVLIRSLPFGDPDRLVEVWTTTSSEEADNHSAGDFLDLHDENQAFQALAGYRIGLFSASAKPGEPVQFIGAFVTSEFFEALGVGAEAGRTFTREDERSGERLVVLSRAASNALSDGRPAEPGRMIRIDGEPHTVVGVLAAGVEWPRGSRIWLLAGDRVPPSPVGPADGSDPLRDRNVRYFSAIGRLWPGLTLVQAQGDLARVSAGIQQRHPASAQRRELRLGLLRDRIVGDVRPVLLVLQGAVTLVLLVACANVSSLLMARANGRRRELALRAALGASRTRLIRQLLTESLVLGMIGGIAGLLVGAWLTAMLQRLVPDSIPRTGDIAPDLVVALATCATALLTGVLFGILPALQASRARSAEALKHAGERGSAGRHGARAALVTAQVALTLVLLSGAGLLLSALLRLSHVDSGMTRESVTLVSLTLPEARYPTGAAQAELYRRILTEIGSHGQIEAVGVGFPGPLRGAGASGAFFIEGRSTAPADRPFANIASISADYPAALGIPLVEGRLFSETDTASAPDVALVSRALARRYWPGESAVGKRLRFDDDGGAPWRTVVGVVGDTRQLGLHADTPPIMFIPYAQFPLPFTNLAIRSTAPAGVVASLVRARLAGIDPDLAPGEMRSLQSVLHDSLDEPRFRAWVVSAFAVAALVLAVVGVYGLISYSVTQRTREIGIRLALGAPPRLVLALMIREGVILSVSGVGLGLAGALLSGRMLATLVLGVETADPFTLAASAALLLAAAALATYVPARRALRVDPMHALRVE
ncbi:MAG TPA: ABC transporter permease [Vicinamibacterales bacterium]|nr:ABC transporter permease [Vicinamibacterales bacterium]